MSPRRAYRAVIAPIKTIPNPKSRNSKAKENQKMEMKPRMPIGTLPFGPGSSVNTLDIEITNALDIQGIRVRDTGDIRQLGIHRTDTGEAFLWEFLDPLTPEEYQQTWANIFRFCGEYPILAFNASYDYGCLKNHLRNNGIQMPDAFQRRNWKEAIKAAEICFPMGHQHNLESFFRNACPIENSNEPSRTMPDKMQLFWVIAGTAT